MTNNEVKKALYKEKPIAKLRLEDAHGYSYHTYIESIRKDVDFFVSFDDMGTSMHRFKDEMPSHELIRWII